MITFSKLQFDRLTSNRLGYIHCKEMNTEAVSETNKHMDAIPFHPSLLSFKAVKFNDT